MDSWPGGKQAGLDPFTATLDALIETHCPDIDFTHSRLDSCSHPGDGLFSGMHGAPHCLDFVFVFD
jgi:hypothetical protein